MGNTQIKSQQSNQEFNNFQQIRRQPLGAIMMHKDSQLTYLLKEYTYASELLYYNEQKRLQAEIDRGVIDNMLNVVRFETKVMNSFCSSSFKIYAIYEYPQVTLKDEIMARQKESKYFQEDELISILQSCLNALIDIKPTVSLNPTNIFINPDGQIKVIHPDLFDDGYRMIIQDHFYYSPEKICNFNRNDNQISLRKEAVFSVAMTLLHAANLEDLFHCYDYQQRIFFDQNLETMIEGITERYSAQFVEMIANMLETNPNRRASLMEIQGILNSFWNEQGSTQKQSMGSSKLQHMESVMSKSQQKQFKEEQSFEPNDYQIPQEKYEEQIYEKPRDSIKVTVPEQSRASVIKQSTFVQKESFSQENKQNKDSIYTDPKLLEMIRKDLEDINELKKSSFIETKYSYMYPQTESILSSIKKFDEPKEPEHKLKEFDFNIQNNKKELFSLAESKKQSYSKQPTPIAMKKQKEAGIFTVQTYNDGSKYQGMMLNGKKHGHGRYTYQQGSFYEGEYRNDKMNGQGTIYYALNRPAYQGNWMDDQFHGHGALYNQDPQSFDGNFNFQDFNCAEEYWVKYQGQFYLDNKCGFGKLYFSNGEMVEGQFGEDCLNGRAKFYSRDGQVVNGKWSNNMLTQIF